MSYRGRFAPTPSGPLHFGSLVAALASWLDARHKGGQWLVRIDDLDPPREQPGAADTILRQLDACGLHWDHRVYYQSERHPAYQRAVEQLLATGQAFYCQLTRKQLMAMNYRHPGKKAAVDPGDNTAVRLTVADRELCLDDRIQGRVCANLQQEGGAFVIRRKDGFFGYQLACALDDADQGITRVVRGSDLLGSTFRQRWLLACLNRPAPDYAHLPVVTEGRELKLSKSRGSTPLTANQACHWLTAALTCMGLTVPDDLRGAPVNTLLEWGLRHYADHQWPPGKTQPMPAFLQTNPG